MVETGAVKVIDGHVHVGRWRTPDFSGRATEVEDAARLYAELGYTSALVMPTDTGENARLLDGLLASSFPFRFCAWIDPADPAAAAFLDERRDDVAALKVHPSFLRRRADDEVFEPFYRWGAAHGTPVLVHCGRWLEMASWRFPLAAAVRHPDVAFVLCHMGGDGTDLVEGAVEGVLASGADNVFFGTESIRQYWIVRHAISRLGPERVIFGSDYNLNHPRSFEAVVDALDLPPAARERVFFHNLNELLPAALRLPA